MSGRSGRGCGRYDAGTHYRAEVLGRAAPIEGGSACPGPSTKG